MYIIIITKQFFYTNLNHYFIFHIIFCFLFYPTIQRKLGQLLSRINFHNPTRFIVFFCYNLLIRLSICIYFFYFFDYLIFFPSWDIRELPNGILLHFSQNNTIVFKVRLLKFNDHIIIFKCTRIFILYGKIICTICIIRMILLLSNQVCWKLT